MCFYSRVTTHLAKSLFTWGNYSTDNISLLLLGMVPENKAIGKAETSGTERLVKDWCHSQDKCLVILTQPTEPLTNKFQPCLLSSLRSTKIYEKFKLCGRRLSQALATWLSHPLVFGLLKLNNSSAYYVDYGNAVTLDGLAKWRIAVKYCTVVPPADTVVS